MFLRQHDTASLPSGVFLYRYQYSTIHPRRKGRAGPLFTIQIGIYRYNITNLPFFCPVLRCFPVHSAKKARPGGRTFFVFGEMGKRGWGRRAAAR
ncbi:hypothetical protein HMPREF0262_00476 [Clostridium sp. ATCC 29733]|nr:hypothetical protein HMPREF0262_00476 [Clostridium sp. ATCC 29733]